VFTVKPSVALCVTGSIAAYKAAMLARLLLARGVRVRPLMTEGAQRFLGASTLSGLCAEPVLTSMWDPNHPGELHVTLGREVDLVAVVPATADVLARLAQGRASDLLTALMLSTQAHKLVAPSMHPNMWQHPATMRNLALLRADGVIVVGPELGPVASGDVGMGRMSEPETIALAIERALACSSVERKSQASAASAPEPNAAARSRDLEGVRMVISAGPTYEDLDPVRFLGNRSSGKMGFAIAAEASQRGASVTLVAGPVERETPPNVTRINVRSALEMQAAIDDAVSTPGALQHGADVVIMAAAVADFRSAFPSAGKIKKTSAVFTLQLEQNPDIIAALGSRRAGSARPILVGFALETGSDASVIAYGKQKLLAKQVDLIVANEAQEGLSGDGTRIHLITSAEVRSLGPLSKALAARHIVDRVREFLAPSGSA
jgi:phosphopantothenoylcysteine decarboxylase / phosphopantothenate---cysteine ligase